MFTTARTTRLTDLVTGRPFWHAIPSYFQLESFSLFSDARVQFMLKVRVDGKFPKITLFRDVYYIVLKSKKNIFTYIFLVNYHTTVCSYIITSNLMRCFGFFLFFFTSHLYVCSAFPFIITIPLASALICGNLLTWHESPGRTQARTPAAPLNHKQSRAAG